MNNRPTLTYRGERCREDRKEQALRGGALVTELDITHAGCAGFVHYSPAPTPSNPSVMFGAGLLGGAKAEQGSRESKGEDPLAPDRAQ